LQKSILITQLQFAHKLVSKLYTMGVLGGYGV